MMNENYVAEVAKVFGKTIDEPFKVKGGSDPKTCIAVVRFSYLHGMDRFDGHSWNGADYFLGPLLTGRIHIVDEVEQGSLF